MNSSFITITITIAATVAGQLLTKKGMSLAGPMPADKGSILVFLLRTMLLNPYVLAGLLMAVLAAMSWMATLSKTELSYAYPFMSLAFPLVLLLSSLIFHESFSLARWLGITVIIAGVIIVAKG
ncbi:MAG: EamA family transporter [Peptococcaceae bacterium]|nr:EamA family transporter [Peptococcaceae bacterium]